MNYIQLKVTGKYIAPDGEKKQFKTFECDVEIPNIREEYWPGVVTHRYLEHALKLDNPPEFFSRVKIGESKVLDKKVEIKGKDVLHMSEDQIQDLAAIFDIKQIPLRDKMDIDNLRSAAAKLYLKKVQGIHVDKVNDFWIFDEKTGGRVFSWGNQKVIVDEEGFNVEAKGNSKSFASMLKESQIRRGVVIDEAGLKVEEVGHIARKEFEEKEENAEIAENIEKQSEEAAGSSN
jgi:hypothetical protein